VSGSFLSERPEKVIESRKRKGDFPVHVGAKARVDFLGWAVQESFQTLGSRT
jgi:hypothetical protein